MKKLFFLVTLVVTLFSGNKNTKIQFSDKDNQSITIEMENCRDDKAIEEHKDKEEGSKLVATIKEIFAEKNFVNECIKGVICNGVIFASSVLFDSNCDPNLILPILGLIFIGTTSIALIDFLETE